MDSLQIAVLSIVQGITELLPISSTGHVLLTSQLFFKGEPDILLLTVLQFGTTIAILLSFRDFLFKDMFNEHKIGLYLKIALASLPAVIAALLFEDVIEKWLYNPEVIAFSLFIWAFAMILVERVKFKNSNTVNDMTDVSLFQAMMVGIAQAFAIIPGTSRSGSTTVVGILTGIEKFTALKFSFLLGLPLLVGSFLYELLKHSDQLNVIFSPLYVMGMVISGIVGFISILVLQRFSKNNFLTVFGVYRILLAITVYLTIIR